MSNSIILSAEEIETVLRDGKILLCRPVDGIVEVPGPYSTEAWHRGEMPRCPYGPVGTELWVQEDWTQDLPHECRTCGGDDCCLVGYRDGAVHLITISIWPDPQDFTVQDFNEAPEWQTAETMPQHLSRINLIITDITVKEDAWILEFASV